MTTHAIVAAVICAATCQPAELRIWDGDTFRIGAEAVRIVNIDTPEIGDKARCDAEERLAELAKARLVELLAGQDVEILRDGRDKYGRTLAVVRVGARDVGDALVAEGLARTWTGRREPWC